MTQKSYFWDNTGVGDGQTYTFEEWTDLWTILFTSDPAEQGYLPNNGNELEVTANGANTVQVDTGFGFSDGKIYPLDIAFDISGLGNGTSGRIVLRKTTATAVVRAVQRAVGALTQTAAVWEIPLASYSVDGGGVVTVTDERVAAVSPLAPAAAVDGNMQLIQTVVGDGTSTIIDFTGIPATFDHLLIQGIARIDLAVVVSSLKLRFNLDGGANYNDNNIKANNVTYSGDENQSQNRINVGFLNGASASANRFSSFKIWIPYYKETGFYKGVLYEEGTIPNNTPAGTWEELIGGGIWMNTSAITRIQLLNLAGGNLVAGTSMSLYGIKQ